MTEVSSTRLYLGNLPRNGKASAASPRRASSYTPLRPAPSAQSYLLTPSEATKADVEAHFASHGTGEITEIKLMNGFGFIEYKDAMDARDVVPGKLPPLPPPPEPSPTLRLASPCAPHSMRRS